MIITLKKLINFILIYVGIPIVIFLLFNLIYLVFNPKTELPNLITSIVYNVVAFVIILVPLYFLNQKRDKLKFFRKILLREGTDNWKYLFSEKYKEDKEDLTTREFRLLGEELYAVFLKKFLENYKLPDDEIEKLAEIQNYFGLDKIFLERMKSDIGKPVLTKLFKICYEDLELTEEETTHIFELAGALGITKEEVDNIDKNVVLGKYQKAIHKVLEDNLYTDEEIREITELKQKLGLSNEELNLSSEAKQLDFFHKLYLIEKGEIPVIEPSISFPVKENVYMELDATRLEYIPDQKFLEHRGFVPVLKKGENFLLGKSRKPNVSPTGKGRFPGKLFLTSKRILFMHESRTVHIPYANLVEMEIFRNGVCLKKNDGKQFLLEFNNEDELFSLIVSKIW